MDTSSIQTALELMDKNLSHKGCRPASIMVQIRPHSELYGYVGYYPDTNASLIYETFYQDSAEDLVSAMRKFVDEVQPLEDRQREEYLRKLAATIEYGRSIGLDENFINPLALQMKKLSSNVIEHKRDSGIINNRVARTLDDDIPF